MRFRRTDSGAAVDVRFDASAAPRAPEITTLLPAIVLGTATAAERSRFADLWQSRVARILTSDPASFLSLRTVA